MNAEVAQFWINLVANVGLPVALLIYLLRFTQNELVEMKVAMIRIQISLAIIANELGVAIPNEASQK